MSEKRIYDFLRILLRIGCVLPRSDTDTSYKWQFYCFMMPSYLFGLFSLLLHLWYLSTQISKEVFKRLFVEVFLHDIMVLTAYSGILYCVICTYSNNHTMMNLLNDLEDFTKFGLPPNVDIFVRNSKRIIWIFIGYYFSIVTVFMTYGIMNSEYCEELNRLYDMNTVCAYINYAWYPINLNYTPVKQIIATFLGIITYPLVLTAVGAAVIICVSLFNIVVRIKHLKLMLEEALAIEHTTECRDALVRCYKYYKDIRRLTLKVNKIFSTYLLVYTCLCGSIIGISGCQFILMKTVQSLVLIIGWIPVLFYVSYLGEDVKSESLSISVALFGMNWYEKDVKIQKEIRFLLLALKKPLVICIPGFSQVDLTTFSAMVKTAYNFLMVFYQTL